MSEIICKNQRLIESQRICCYDSEQITIKHSFDKASVLEINFIFHYDDEALKYRIESAENGKVNIHLHNFRSSFGTGLKKAQAIGKYNGHEISIVFFVTLLPDANPILDYSMYMEV